MLLFFCYYCFHSSKCHNGNNNIFVYQFLYSLVYIGKPFFFLFINTWNFSHFFKHRISYTKCLGKSLNFLRFLLEFDFVFFTDRELFLLFFIVSFLVSILIRLLRVHINQDLLNMYAMFDYFSWKSTNLLAKAHLW